MTVRYVYCLVDPRDKAVRYVGIAKNPKARMCSHRACLSYGKVRHWAMELRDLGMSPEMRVLEQVEDDGSSEREGFWIAHFLTQGAVLLNQYCAATANRRGNPFTSLSVSLPPLVASDVKAQARARGLGVSRILGELVMEALEARRQRGTPERG